jgi:hypothetical protein
VTCPAHTAVDLAVARLQAFAHDRRRRNALMLTGYVVLNFTWAQVFGDPESASRPSGERRECNLRDVARPDKRSGCVLM